MESAFAWLGQLFEWLGGFFPRLLNVRVTDGGVAFSGKRARRLSPGYHIYFPFLTEIQVIPVVRQSLNLNCQALITADDCTVVAGGIVFYEIKDYYKALTENWDIAEIVTDFSLAAIRSVITIKDKQTLQRERKTIDHELTQQLHKQLKDFGIVVLQARLTDFSECLTLNHIGVANGKT